ncbi:acylphosphatase [Ammonifex degensii KC4]|uniref:Acylphosphatase n=1 Tax=Ammonifex degensii (strain DSM 10501 / KC4) TaxID=429009 RepID=C9R9A5_AMMDK|nr:acylphosphatase [Ammonifex degensii]ACX52884.1 acylphosphatase [Ammonifex degensii KC4]
MKQVRAHVIVHGKVQGVYFRASTLEKAREEGVTGWVRNRPDGTVEAVFEGEEERVKRMIAWCHQGPPWAEVERVEVNWEDWRGEFTDFTIRR